MKLYFSPGACSLAPHIVMEELGLNYQTEMVDLRTKQTASHSDYNKINPKGSVPAVETKDGVITECAVLLQYLCDQKPEKNLIPKIGTMDRYRCIEWLNYIATEVHKGYSPMWVAERVFPDSTEKAHEFKTAHVKLLDRKLDFLNNHFKNNQFLMGTEYSAADAYLFTILGWSKPLKLDLSKYPGIFGFMERMMGRPAVQKAMKAEGLI